MKESAPKLSSTNKTSTPKPIHTLVLEKLQSGHSYSLRPRIDAWDTDNLDSFRELLTKDAKRLVTPPYKTMEKVELEKTCLAQPERNRACL